MTFDKQEKLLREKEKLVRKKRKLDESKKDNAGHKQKKIDIQL